MDVWSIAVTALVGFISTFALGFVIIPKLKKLKFGQTILDIGPAWHKKDKQGTPTMGGIMFIIGTVLAFAVGLVLLYSTGQLKAEGAEKLNLFNAVSGIVMAVSFGFVGFLDDFIKIKKKQNEGLTPNQKIIFQVLIIAAYFTAKFIMGDTRTIISIPFIGQIDLWIFYYLLMGLGMLYLVNAVNLTDGIDGLCTSVTFNYCAAMVVVCALLQFTGLQALGISVCGALIGFLIWNAHPAKVFMGDTGSLFLGGIVCALGVGADVEIIMIICSAVYIWEALSVLIQMTYFKITHGKRLFKMTPIHHSFEIRGWSEKKIDTVFSLISLGCGIIGVLLVSGL